MNIKEIKELMKMMVETDITELNLESDGTKIAIKKATAGTIQPVVTVTPTTPVVDPVEVSQSGGMASVSSSVEEKNNTIAPNQVLITAPMVGTFYEASNPGSEPFVQAGQTVEPGQTLCIIEAMKLMNEIESDMRAKIVQVLVDDSEPVEYGQPLFILEKL
jgi:oxaloacetate decarboxylase alpha subunit